MENLLEELEQNWNSLDELTQNIIALGLIIIGIWILRSILLWMITTQLRRIAEHTQTQWDDIILNHLEIPLRFFSIALMLLVMLSIFQLEPRLDHFLNSFAQMLMVISVGIFIYRILENSVTDPYWIQKIWGTSIHESLLPFVRTTLRIVLFSITVITIIEVWGYDVNGLVAGLGIGGLAVALAAQDTISNLFGFSTIVGDQPFVVGEYIKTPDVEGRVEKVGLRSTRIRQLDQALVTVPNSKLSNAAVLNWSRLSKRRIDFTLGLNYDTTSGQMRDLLKELRQLLKDWNTVESDTVVVYFTNFGASSLDILIRCYVFKVDWGEFTAEKELIQLAIMELVEKHHLSIAFPSHELYVRSFPEVTAISGRQPEKPTTDRSTRYIPLAPDGESS